MKPEQLSRASPHEQLSPSDTAFYQAIVRSLSYLMNCSRLDLAVAINRLAQFTSCPAERHLVAAKLTLRYLRPSCLILGLSSMILPLSLNCVFKVGLTPAGLMTRTIDALLSAMQSFTLLSYSGNPRNTVQLRFPLRMLNVLPQLR